MKNMRNMLGLLMLLSAGYAPVAIAADADIDPELRAAIEASAEEEPVMAAALADIDSDNDSMVSNYDDEALAAARGTVNDPDVPVVPVVAKTASVKKASAKKAARASTRTPGKKGRGRSVASLRRSGHAAVAHTGSRADRKAAKKASLNAKNMARDARMRAASVERARKAASAKELKKAIKLSTTRTVRGRLATTAPRAGVHAADGE